MSLLAQHTTLLPGIFQALSKGPLPHRLALPTHSAADRVGRGVVRGGSAFALELSRACHLDFKLPGIRDCFRSPKPFEPQILTVR